MTVKLSELDGETMLFCNELGCIVSKKALLEHTLGLRMKRTCYLANKRIRGVRIQQEPRKAEYKTGDIFDIFNSKQLEKILEKPETEVFLKLLNQYPLYEIGEEVEDDC